MRSGAILEIRGGEPSVFIAHPQTPDMRPVTALVLAGIVVLFGGIGALTLGGALGGTGGETADLSLTEAWISDTARNVTLNHHAIGANNGVVVAPVATIATNDSTLSRTSCSLNRLGTADGTVQWQTEIPPEQCFMHALSQPAISDIDSDDNQEVIASQITEETVVYNGSTGERKFSIPLTTYGYARPIIVNLTAHSGPEIVASDIKGHVVVATNTGDIEWERSLDDDVITTPIGTDVDADGEPEVVIGTGDRVVVLDADGNIEWQVAKSGENVAVGQTDDDAAREILTGSLDGLRALDGRNGTTEWNYSITGGASLSPQAIADGDGDGQSEVFFSEPGHVVGAVDGETGSEEWSTRLAPEENGPTPPPIAADVTGDGNQEVIAVTNEGLVTVLDPGTGEQLAVYQRDVPIYTFTTAAEITESPGAEVLVRYGDGRVVALNYGAP